MIIYNYARLIHKTYEFTPRLFLQINWIFKANDTRKQRKDVTLVALHGAGGFCVPVLGIAITPDATRRVSVPVPAACSLSLTIVGVVITLPLLRRVRGAASE